MKIGLIDVDGHNYPNFALMKISAYHKKLGDTVQWADYFDHYDIVYMSKIFTFTPDHPTLIRADKIIRGGTGYDIKSKLPEEIENHKTLDYTIYPMYNFSIQMFSRGCVRKCSFCVVKDKEGRIQSTEPVEINPDCKYIDVLDNNFFANPNWEQAVDWIMTTGKPVNLRGVDIRIMTERQAMALSKMKIKNDICIAWDNPKDDILPNLKNLLKHIGVRKIRCYMLIGFDSTQHDDYRRAIELKKLGIRPHCQPFRDYENKRMPSQYEKDFAGWVNKPIHFMACDFMDFEPRKGFYCREYFNLSN
jgi:hypothetical protein